MVCFCNNLEIEADYEEELGSYTKRMKTSPKVLIDIKKRWNKYNRSVNEKMMWYRWRPNVYFNSIKPVNKSHCGGTRYQAVMND